MATSNRPIGSPSPQSTALSGADCGRCCANSSTDRVRDDAYAIINNGRIPSSLILGYSRCLKLINWRANPDVETTDRRARRGKTAQRVRREGTASAVPYPYSPGSRGRAGGVVAATGAYARVGRPVADRSADRVFAGGDGMTCRSQRTVCSPWTDLIGGNHPASFNQSAATDQFAAAKIRLLGQSCEQKTGQFQ